MAVQNVLLFKASNAKDGQKGIEEFSKSMTRKYIDYLRCAR